MSSDDFLAIYLCNERLEQGEPNPLLPLVRYLESAKPITPDMRKWLVGMLAENGDSPFRLAHARRGKGAPKGRKKAERFVYLRAGSLQDQIVTPEFMRSLSETTGWNVAPDADPNPKVYRLGDEEPDQYGISYIKHRVALVVGQRLSNRQIEEIISAETYWSFDRDDWASLRTVQRYLQGWERPELPTEALGQ